MKVGKKREREKHANFSQHLLAPSLQSAVIF